MKMKLKKQQLLSMLPNALVQTHGSRSGNARFLSFDDGPHPEHTPRLLDLLSEHGAHASFFLVGQRAEAHPALVERIIAEGHLVGNHSWSHKLFGESSLRRQIEEINRTDALLRTFDGRKLHRVRPPQGSLPLSLLLHFARTRRSVVYWSYDSLDYKQQAATELVARLCATPPRVGDIVLMHDDSALSVDALRVLLPQWLAERQEFHALAPEVA